MTIVATGTLEDRPFGRTLATIAQRRFSGELRIDSAGIRFGEGLITGASGSHPADSAVKTALGAGLITSSQASEILRNLARADDDVTRVAELAKLGPDHTARLRRRVVANRAMRLFAIEQGSFSVDNVVPAAPEIAPLDARTIIYLGVRAHFSEERTQRELGKLGIEFKLRADAADLDTFAFGDAEKVVLDTLSRQPWQPMSLAAAVPAVESRTTMAVLYALAVWGLCEITGPRTTRPSLGPLHTQPPPPGSIVKKPTAPPPVAANNDGSSIRTLITERLALLSERADHFKLLGVAQDAPEEAIRRAYFELARQLHPDRIVATGLDDLRGAAQRLFAQINLAFGILSGPKRAEYVATLHAGGEDEAQRAEHVAEEKALKLFKAEEHFRNGEMALRRNRLDTAVLEFRKAVELNPDEAEHHALLAWANWCLAADKTAAAKTARHELDKAVRLSPMNPTPHLYLGKIARTLGDDERAAVHFRNALDIAPGHGDATSELRILEARLSSKPRSKPKTIR